MGNSNKVHFKLSRKSTLRGWRDGSDDIFAEASALIFVCTEANFMPQSIWSHERYEHSWTLDGTHAYLLTLGVQICSRN
ncbi:hypothetical protein CEXT_132091 [Caerostris extrusa]|uniref:Uncharacterized protein n=1 Tax=Caerostris extrusa TaxID=172846 RepID=A0AAV4WI67_CAEEX|nr:hypothetical protein CEXT_132091 [Caerostris extrusa]